MIKTDLRNFSYDELMVFIAETFGEKPYRGRQIFEWIYQHGVVEFEQMTNLSKELRADLDRLCTIAPLELSAVKKSEDGTEKLQFTLKDGAAVESVLMPAEDRHTLCISTQVGCAMGCSFCFTGSLKLFRNLECHEIVDQYRQAQRHLGEGGPRISNVVVMGMGEPLHNFDNTVRACNLLMHQHAYNLSGRKLTVSTCGITDRIEGLAEQTNVNLAVSLNATTNEVRSQLMPINKKYPLAELIQALDRFPKARRKRIFLEYILLDGINNSRGDVIRLIKIARRLGCKVNLIPFNPHDASDFKASSMEQVLEFQKPLIEAGIDTFIRQSRGQDIYGACGMLGKTTKVE